MVLKNKNSNKKVYWIILFIILFILVFRSQINQIKDIGNIIFIPIKNMIFNSTSNTKEKINNLIYFNKVTEELKERRAEVYKLTIENLKLIQLEEENIRLRDLLKMQQENKMDFIVANVSFRDSMSIYEGFTIDKGRKDNIEEGMIVLYKDMLIGKITKVYNKYSIVDMLTKKGFNVSVLSGENNNLGVLSGNNNNKLSLEYIIIDADINKGDMIKTSGVSDVYIKNIPVGFISDIKKSKDNLFKIIDVKLLYNILEIEEVIIIKKKELDVDE